MERIPVSSSNLRTVGYDPDSSTLEIEFKSGAVYQYQGVPQAEFDAFMNAGSKGTYFHANIKDRYATIKL
jgi:hypothetical protein